MGPFIEQNIWQPFQNQIQVLGLDIYNGNSTQLSIFRQTTRVTFPLLLNAANGTSYGANREDLVVVDQAGIVRLKVGAQSSGSRQRVADLIRDLLANPPTSPPILALSDNALTETIELGQKISQTFTLTNTGGSDLIVTDIQPTNQSFSDLMLSHTAFTLNPGEMQDIIITGTPTQKGMISDTFEIYSNAQGDHSLTVLVIISNEFPLAVNDTVRIMPEERINISVLQNDFDPDKDALTITGITEGLHSERVEVNSNGTIHYRPNPGNFASDSFTYTIGDAWGGTATATVVIIVTEPVVSMPNKSPNTFATADFNSNGRVDFPDFLLFTQAYQSTNPQYDLDENGVVGFGDFLIFTQSYGMSVSN